MPLKVKHMNLLSCWKRGEKKSTGLESTTNQGKWVLSRNRGQRVGAPLSSRQCALQNHCSHPSAEKTAIILKSPSELVIFRHSLCIRKCRILAASVLLVGMINQQGYMNMSISKARRKGKLKSPRPFWGNNHKSYRLHFLVFFCIMIKSVSSITPLRKIKGRQWGKEVHNDFH